MTNGDKIYHITHIDNLLSIFVDGCLWSDAQKIAKGINNINIGNSGIKNQRLYHRDVTTNLPTKVGEYVPFYFCPRSPMLYVIHKDNQGISDYSGDQSDIVHLVFETNNVYNWGQNNNKHCSYTDINAALAYATFNSNLAQIGNLNWNVINGTEFSNASGKKEIKQAEFLIQDLCPINLLAEIGVYNHEKMNQVAIILNSGICSLNVPVNVRREWYF